MFVAAIWFHIWKNLSSTQFATSELIFLLRPATPVLFPASLVIGRVTDSRTQMKEFFEMEFLETSLDHYVTSRACKKARTKSSFDRLHIRRIVKLNCIMQIWPWPELFPVSGSRPKCSLMRNLRSFPANTPDRMVRPSANETSTKVWKSQVWSLNQLHILLAFKDRRGVGRCGVFFTITQSGFASVVLVGVLWPPSLKRHIWQSPCFSVVPEATHKAVVSCVRSASPSRV